MDGLNLNPESPAAGQAADGAGVFADSLLAVVTPELYRRNAFRVLEMGVHSTTKDLKRQADQLKMREALGTALTKSAGALALDPPADADAMREALQRLHDPEQRLVEEFFWFWPMTAGDAADPALSALAAGDVPSASRLWHEAAHQGPNRAVAAHNLAILHHALALDAELKKADAAQSWQLALQHWAAGVEDDELWRRLAVRIRELDDPRLSDDTARRLRRGLPVAILALNAQLAVEARGADECRRHLDLVHQSGMNPNAIAAALRRAVEPILARIKSVCQAAEQEAKADPVHGDRAAQRLREQAGPLLGVLDKVCPQTPTHDAACDQTAQSAFDCVRAFSGRTENWPRTLECLQSIRALARGASLLQTLDDNIKQIQQRQDASHDWCGEGYWNTPAPILRQLETAREYARGRTWDSALNVLEKLLLSAHVRQQPPDGKIIRKALAYTLAMCANEQVTVALDESARPLAIPPKMEFTGMQLYRRLIDLMAQGIGGLGGHNEGCDVCRAPIYERYYQFAIKNNGTFFLCAACKVKIRSKSTTAVASDDSAGLDVIPFVTHMMIAENQRRVPITFGPAAASASCGACGSISLDCVPYTFKGFLLYCCMRCGESLNAEQARRRTRLSAAIATAGADLMVARELDPRNTEVEKAADTILKSARELSVPITPSILLRLRFELASPREILGARSHADLEVRNLADQCWEDVDENVRRTLLRNRLLMRLATWGAGIGVALVLGLLAYLRLSR